MKTIYLDCSMGAAGDMLSAALLELTEDKETALGELNALGIPHVRYEAERCEKHGIVGTHMSVKIDGHEEGDEHAEHHHHHGRHMEDIRNIVSALNTNEKVKRDIMAVYTLIADAESHVHGRPVSEVHFHEVGALDAIADIAAVCLLIDRLGADEVCASVIHVGSGTVSCAHGILPVPAPATAHILRGIPCCGGEIKGELCTPTGAALLRHFVRRFGDMPVIRVDAIGYGMGKKDFPRANALRAMIGETEAPTERIAVLSFNVDDMTAEQISFASERLFASGAVEVFTLPAGMKKSRPGTLVCALCHEEKKAAVISAIFKNTSTLGVRESECRRHVLERRFVKYDTPYGEVRSKISEGYGVKREKLEYEDLARIARENDTGIDQAAKMVEEHIINSNQKS